MAMMPAAVGAAAYASHGATCGEKRVSLRRNHANQMCGRVAAIARSVETRWA